MLPLRRKIHNFVLKKKKKELHIFIFGACNFDFCYDMFSFLFYSIENTVKNNKKPVKYT